MVLALAPRLSRWWLAGVFLAAAPSITLAQDGPGKTAGKKEDPAKDEAKQADKDKDEDAKAGVIDKEKMEKQETAEIFEDPRAKALLNPKAFKEFP
ncbi:MAG TPA: hypothetical protein VGH33_21250, partial [Isosphaeraceae bacterium]